MGQIGACLKGKGVYTSLRRNYPFLDPQIASNVDKMKFGPDVIDQCLKLAYESL